MKLKRTRYSGSSIISLSWGTAYIAIERHRGTYGLQHTVSYCLRWSTSW